MSAHSETSPVPGGPPPATARLFADPAEVELVQREPGAFVIGRLLEEGDTEDLRWLARSVGEDALARWLAERGPRQMSRRSRAFWSLVLTGAPPVDAAHPADFENPLWAL